MTLHTFIRRAIIRIFLPHDYVSPVSRKEIESIDVLITDIIVDEDRDPLTALLSRERRRNTVHLRTNEPTPWWNILAVYKFDNDYDAEMLISDAISDWAFSENEAIPAAILPFYQIAVHDRTGLNIGSVMTTNAPPHIPSLEFYFDDDERRDALSDDFIFELFADE